MVPVFAREYFKEGGYRSLPTVEDMHAIPKSKRKEGMLIRITGEQQFYILEGGLENNNFQPIQLGGSAAKLTGYLKTADADKKYYSKQEVDAAIQQAVTAVEQQVDGSIEQAIIAAIQAATPYLNLDQTIVQAVIAAILAQGPGAPASSPDASQNSGGSHS